MVIRKKATTAAQAQSSQAVNAALRSGEGDARPRLPAALRAYASSELTTTFSLVPYISGAAVDTLKKHEAGSNKGGGGGKNMAKLENETEVFAHDTVSSELKKQISSARLAKKLTQAQLGQLINEKPQVINEYESGKAIPNPQVLSKMSRVLGVTLKKGGAKK